VVPNFRVIFTQLAVSQRNQESVLLNSRVYLCVYKHAIPQYSTKCFRC